MIKTNKPAFVLAIVFLSHAAFNFFLSSFVDTMGGHAVGDLLSAKEFFQHSCLGALQSQIFLLALVASLGPFPMAMQVPAAALGVVILYWAQALAGQFPDQPIRDTIGSLIQFIMLAIPLWAVRRLCGCKIGIPRDGSADGSPAKTVQFGMRWLFEMIFFVAIAFTVVHYTLRFWPKTGWPPGNQDSGLETLFDVIRPIGLLPLAVAMFVEKRAIRWMFLGLLCGVVSEITGWLGLWGWEELDLQIAALVVGTLAAVVVSLLPLRWVGCRIVKYPSPKGRINGLWRAH